MRTPRIALCLALLVTAGIASCSPLAATSAVLSPTPPAALRAAAALAPTSIPVTPTATALPTFTPVPTPFAGGLYVDAAQDLGPISPRVYGSNYGPWLFVTLEMQPQAIAAKISYLRYPGGNWGDLNDLDEWQIDQFITFCKQMGSEPALSVRLLDGSPEKAAALVKLVNVTKGYGVRYWSIGNEPSLYRDYDTVRYNQEWRQFADAMRAVDPSILLVGPDIHQFTANFAQNPKDFRRARLDGRVPQGQR